MKKTIFLTGILLGVSAIILGAFAAHGLEKVLSTEQLITFETGVRYQMYHALFLLVLGNLSFLNKKSKRLVFYCVLIGVILFSFSIYLLATNPLTSMDFKTLEL